MDSTQLFINDILKNKNNQIILEKLPMLGLNDCWLVAGCLFQTVWNLMSNKPPEENISDYDIFYFDSDTSYEAEDEVVRRTESYFHDIKVKVDLKNQARVPIWYKEKTGFDYPKVNSAKENIGRFLLRCNCVGIKNDDNNFEVYAPFGLDDIYEGILKTNESVLSFSSQVDVHKKADKYISKWPWLKFVE